MFVYFEIEMTNSRTGLVILWLFLNLRPKSLLVRSIMALAHLMSCEFPRAIDFIFAIFVDCTEHRPCS